MSSIYLHSLIQTFEAIFPTLQIRGGADEPFYQAPKSGHSAMLFFREDYTRSLLHEMAHYCLAGNRRRQLDDFGFWYTPCGRDAHQQAEFERVEARPQGLEWVFCELLDLPFSPSLDDFSGRPPSPEFLENLKAAYIEMKERPPTTAKRAICGLQSYAKTLGVMGSTAHRMQPDRD